MAIDSAEKRLSMMKAGVPFLANGTYPTGSINANARLDFMWIYRGLGAVAGHTATFASILNDILSQVQSILRDSSKTYLAGINDYNITLGDTIHNTSYRKNGIYIEPIEDFTFDDSTSMETTDFKIAVVASVKHYKEDELYIKILNITTDIYDEFMDTTNMTLDGNATYSYVDDVNFSYFDDAGAPEWYVEITLVVRHTHRIAA